MTEASWRIEMRRKTLVNLDPQRRCYNGAYFHAEMRWTEWNILENSRFLKPTADPETRLRFWRELNDYAVSQRGEDARCEFRIKAE